MRNMKRFSLLVAAFVVVAALAPTGAFAQIVELGATKTPLVAPTCPKGASAANCTIILTQVTALEAIRDGVSYPTTVKRAGYLVAWTVGLSRLSSNAQAAHNAVHYLDSSYGGNTEAGISVLKAVGAKSQHRWEVMAESPVVHLQPWLGYVVQFPLSTPLAVKAGEVVALTVPTWAPVLSIDLPTGSFSYRQSRGANCSKPAVTEQAQQTIGGSAQYLCDYPGTRVEYSATEVQSPTVPKNQVHGPRRLAKAPR